MRSWVGEMECGLILQCRQELDQVKQSVKELLARTGVQEQEAVQLFGTPFSRSLFGYNTDRDSTQ